MLQNRARLALRVPAAALSLSISLCLIGCQDKPKPDGPAGPDPKKTDKPYARHTVETDREGQTIRPGAGGDAVTEVPEPLGIHTGVTFKTVLQDPAKADKGKAVSAVNLYAGNGISFCYRAACPDLKWLQFVWKTHYFDGDSQKLEGGSYASSPPHNLDGSPGTTGVKGAYVTDPKSADPPANLDHPAADSPYYQDEGAHSDDGTTIYDAPAHSFKKGGPDQSRAETVVMHFSTYVICDKKVVYHVAWTRTFQRAAGSDKFDKAADKVVDATPKGALTPEEKAALKGAFPAVDPPGPGT